MTGALPRPTTNPEFRIASTANELTKAIILAVQDAYPDRIRLWRNNGGAARGATGRVVRFGVRGQADITGIVGPNGNRLEIEVKTEGDKQSAAQQRFQAMIEMRGGVYILARSVDQCLLELERSIR